MTNLVPLNPDQCFAIADRIAKSPLIPDAYRGKPTEAAIAIMYGNEVGLPPMTSLQRVIVINGKPTLDAAAMTALIRSAGHSLSGDATPTEATAVGKRLDTGDSMSVTFTMDDAKQAGLVRSGPWTKFPKSMLWSRAVSQLARELFSDVLLGINYVPEELEAVEADRKPTTTTTVTWDVEEVTDSLADEGHVSNVQMSTVRQPPAALQPTVVPETGEIIEPVPVPSDADELMKVLGEIVRDTPNSIKLKGDIIARYGPASSIPPDKIQEVIDYALSWSEEPSEVELFDQPDSSF
jgi:hypothetical protein